MDVVGAFTLEAADRKTVVTVVGGSVDAVVVAGRVVAGRGWVGTTTIDRVVVVVVLVVVASVVDVVDVVVDDVELEGIVGRAPVVVTRVVDEVEELDDDDDVVVVVPVPASAGAANPPTSAAQKQVADTAAPNVTARRCLVRRTRRIRLTVLRSTVRL